MATHSSILAWRILWTEEPGAGYSPWGRKESDTTERLHFHFYFHPVSSVGKDLSRTFLIRTLFSDALVAQPCLTL